MSSDPASAKYTIATGAMYISGSITAYNNLSLTPTDLYFVNATVNPANATINMGDGIMEYKFATWRWIINKPGYSVTLSHDFKTQNALLYLINGTLNTNGKNLTVGSLHIGRLYANIVKTGCQALFTGSTITSTGLLSTGVINPESEVADFSTDKTTYNTTGSTIIFRNSQVELNGVTGNMNFTFNDLVFEHPTGTALIPGGTAVEVITNNIIINTPRLSITNVKSTGAPQGYLLKSFAINNTLSFKTKADLSVDFQQLIPMTTFNINNITIDMTGCAVQSTFQAKSPATVNLTGSPLTTSNLAYEGIIFAGSTLTAPESDDAGGNSGTVTWTAVTPKTYYWFGGTGNWGDVNHWSYSSGGSTGAAGCLPTGADNIIADENSFTAVGQYIELTQDAACNNITWNDAGREGALKIPAGSTISLAINGSADFSGVQKGGVYASLNFYGSGTLKSAVDETYSSPKIIFSSSGTYTLANDMLCAKFINPYLIIAGQNTSTFIEHVAGGFNSAGYTISAGSFYSQSSPSTAQRTLDLTNSKIYSYRNTATYYVTSNILLDDKNLTSYSLAGSHFYINTFPASDAKCFLTLVGKTWVLNDVTFEQTTGTSFIYQNYNYQPTDKSSTTMNNLTLNTDFQGFFNNPSDITVNTLKIAPFKTYTFATARTFTIKQSIITPTACSETYTLQAPGPTASLKAEFTPFQIQNAYVKNINATGTKLEVSNGFDLGGNVNVAFTPRAPQTFYWIGGTGSWSNPSHWSATSGGAPNSSGCVPSQFDDVVFDEKSFTAIGQTVTVNVNPVSVHSMTWTAGVNQWQPTLRTDPAAAGSYLINIYGSLELAKDMFIKEGISPSGIKFDFLGTLTAPNSQTINTNGLSAANILMGVRYNHSVGAGRIDILSDINRFEYFQFTSGSLYTNGYDIFNRGIGGGYITISQTGTNTVDISGSDFSGYVGTFQISNCTYWNSAGTNISTGSNLEIKNTSCPVSLNNIFVNGGNLSGNTTYSVTANKITMNGSGQTINGKFVTDTLAYPLFNATQKIQAGTTLTVNEAVISNGTPCSYQTLTSTDETPGGAKATIYVPTPDTVVFPFFNVRNIQGDTRRTADAYAFLGKDLGGNDNIRITAPTAALTYDPILVPYKPFVFDVDVYGMPTKLEWFKDGVLMPDAITSTLNITKSGTYNLRVTYPGSGCITNFYRDITFPNYWMGSKEIDGKVWEKVDNWTNGIIPKDNDDVEFATAANFRQEALDTLIVEKNRIIGTLTNRSVQPLLVPVGNTLKIVNQAITEKPEQIILRSKVDKPNAALIFEKPELNQNVQATVELDSKSYRATSGTYPRVWQYVGSPVKAAIPQDVFTTGGVSGNKFATTDALIRKYNESKSDPTDIGDKFDDVVVTAPMTPFAGYEIVSHNKTYIPTFKGTLNTNDYVSEQGFTSGVYYRGNYLLANSYAAPIFIESLKPENFSNMEQTIYLYSAGSRDQWMADGGWGETRGTSPGQYTAIPIHAAAVVGQTQIPSMQGFMVRRLSNAQGYVSTTPIQFTFNYSNVQRKTDAVNEPMRIKSQADESNQLPLLKIDVVGKQSADCVYIITNSGTKKGFDNGWDGSKQISATDAQIYVKNENDMYQVSADSDIDGTYLGFWTGSEPAYTLHFTLKNMENSYSSVYIEDLKNKTQQLITDGAALTFTPSLAGKEEIRFKLRAISKNKGETTNSNIHIQTMSNHNFLISNNNSEGGEINVYNVSGVAVHGQKMSAGANSLKLDLPAGVYFIVAKTNADRQTLKYILK